ncbi:histone deacetylase family protein [Neisseria chenwenguii]|uniref:Deacetylase n=1 Tax=Neisseria chenwenguii TaxID=1853278 RepID=A0A220S4H8_9NEIS|nr:histone deacetylase family protein [Neisseria chenwenguii]ASK28105.1 deacetylase [Neisseria chenwenguii]ROV57255.1 histone deacetylase family protein [Neisseria chenwenguii]
MKKILRRLRRFIRRLLGIKPRMVWLTHPVFLQHEPGGSHPDSPERIRAVEAELKAQNIWRHLQTAEAGEVSDTQLALVHSRRYLHFLEANQPPEGKIYRIDDDTVMSHDSMTAARFAAGAVVAAVDMVMAKKAHNAFCAARPPGHHAKSGSAGGFCLINSTAVGAMYAIAEYRLQRIAVIDFDVHHGDGTTEIFKDDPRILFLNVFEADLFPFPDLEKERGSSPNMLHTPFERGASSLTFRRRIRNEWLPVLGSFKPELILFSAGFDAHRDDETGRLNLHEADFSWLTHKIVQTASSCNGRIVSVLEGGYTLTPLGKSAAAHIRVLAGKGRGVDVMRYNRRLKQRT